MKVLVQRDLRVATQVALNLPPNGLQDVEPGQGLGQDVRTGDFPPPKQKRSRLFDAQTLEFVSLQLPFHVLGVIRHREKRSTVRTGNSGSLTAAQCAKQESAGGVGSRRRDRPGFPREERSISRGILGRTCQQPDGHSWRLPQSQTGDWRLVCRHPPIANRAR